MSQVLEMIKQEINIYKSLKNSPGEPELPGEYCTLGYAYIVNSLSMLNDFIN